AKKMASTANDTILYPICNLTLPTSYPYHHHHLLASPLRLPATARLTSCPTWPDHLSLQSGPTTLAARTSNMIRLPHRNPKFVPAKPGLVSIGLLSLFFLRASPAFFASEAKNDLQIYFVDVEGGQATLFVTPAGQSLLIDTGWSGHDGRDADRIVAVA